MTTENICRNRPEGCSIGRHLIPYGHSHLPRVRSCPASLKLGLCLCIKPAKSVSRICESASSRQSSSKLPCHRRACFRQAALLSHSHQTPEKPAPALFRARKEGPLGISALPRSDTSGHLGGIESALTGAFHLVTAVGTILRCDFHARSANRLINFCFCRLLARAFDQRPLATHCNLSTSKRTGTAFALAASNTIARGR
jgi:hypothetical protein